jgi:2-phosphoglycerate kinase
MPSLHQSTFTADEAFADTLGRSADSLVLGFGRQAHAVSVGTLALIERAVAERTSLVIEGAHVVPGYLDLDRYAHRILAVPFVVTVTDEERHLAHFAAREDAVASRPAERYVSGFDNIRALQDYIKRQALGHGVPVIPNYSFDQSIAAVMDLVMERVTARAGQAGTASEGPAAAGGSGHA